MTASRKFILNSAAVSLVSCLGIAAAHAQAVSIVTTNAGSFTHSTGAAVAKVMVAARQDCATVSPQQSHGQESVNDGSADISLATISDVQQAVTGTVDWVKKGAQKNIRLISRMVPIRTAALVRLDSPIKTMADIKGKTRAERLSGADIGIPGRSGAAAHLPACRWTTSCRYPPQHHRFGQRLSQRARRDVFWFALGSAKVKQVASGVGGLRALSVSDTRRKQRRQCANSSCPVPIRSCCSLRSGWKKCAARRGRWPTMSCLFARKDLSEEIVYKTTKAMYENKKDMAAVFGALNGFEPDRMAVDYDDLSYHPGAIKFFKEKGQWPPQVARIEYRA